MLNIQVDAIRHRVRPTVQVYTTNIPQPTWEIMGPVSTPTALDRNSWDCGSALPSGPTATPFMFAKPGIVAKFSARSAEVRIVEGYVEVSV